MANVSVCHLLFQLTCLSPGVKLGLIYFSDIVVMVSCFPCNGKFSRRWQETVSCRKHFFAANVVVLKTESLLEVGFAW